MSSTTIDDTDPSISFDNGDEWWLTYNDKAFMGSLTHTDVNGARATVSFKGTSIQVYGNIKDGTSSSYSVDGSSPELFSMYLVETPYKQLGQLFYASPELPDGDHTLVITNMSDDSNYQLILDSLVIKSNPPLPPSPPPPPPPPPSSSLVTTTKLFTSVVVSKLQVVSVSTTVAKTTILSKISSRHPTSSQAITFPTLHPQTTATSLALPTSSSPTTNINPNNTTIPSPVPALKPHDNQLSTAAIIGLAIGSFAAIASLLLLVYIGHRRKKKLQGYSTKPRPLPHMNSPTHPPSTQPSSEPSAPNYSPPFFSEKSLLYAPENIRDQATSARAGDLTNDGDGRTDTVYSPQPGTQSEAGQRSVRDLSPLRYIEPQALAPGPSSNLAGPDTPLRPARPELDAATASSRMSLLPLQERVFTPFNESEFRMEGVSINTNTSDSLGKSSAMGFPSSNVLHQRTPSLAAPNGQVADYDGGSGGGGRRDDAGSSFDELPPYPGTARWSRKYDI